MRLVADENCDFSLVTDLRAAGYDVVAITEQMAGADDQRALPLTISDARVFQNLNVNTMMVIHVFWNQSGQGLSGAITRNRGRQRRRESLRHHFQ
jgi:ribosomal protein L22